MGKWSNAVRTLYAETEKYNSERQTEIKSVHQSLLLRALIILKNLTPETEDFFAPMVRTMMKTVKLPDKKGDYQNGMGMHYYCVGKFSGKLNKPLKGYYRNGIKEYSRTARTMLEESFTMALTFHNAGFIEKSAYHLGRAVHMISDISCLPHSTGMTFYSSKAKVHKAYEGFAEALYPEFLEEQKADILPDLFTSRAGFEKGLNRLGADIAAEIEDFLEDPAEEISERLYDTELNVAALLMRFYEDLHNDGKNANYISTGYECRFKEDTAPLSVKVIEKGIVFHGVNPSPSSKINMTKTVFTAAHRHDGFYTFSPLSERDARVIMFSGNRIILKEFSPKNSAQLFKFND